MTPLRLSGTQRFDELILFHNLNDSVTTYQEVLVPFFLMLMSIRPGRPEESALSIYTPNSGFLLAADSYSKERTGNNQHQHNCFEFTYVLDGSMYQVVEGKRFFYPTGSCCLMNRNTLHTEEVSTDFTCIFMSVSTEFVENLLGCRKALMFASERGFYSNLIIDFLARNLIESESDSKDFLDFIPLITQTEQVVLIHQIFEDMLHTLINPPVSASYRIVELFLSFVAMLCNDSYYNAVHVTAKSNMDSILFARIDRILNERHGRITNQELARVLNYNGTYLGRIVKKCTGRSLFDYSMTFAMNYAAQCLLHTDKSASEIALELHFSNRSHFYRIFKEQFGLTPKEYRDANLLAP